MKVVRLSALHTGPRTYSWYTFLSKPVVDPRAIVQGRKV